jgi:hypothetical protein
MSDDLLPKIKIETLIQIAILLVLVSIVAGNARFIIDNLIRSREVDEKIVTEANPRLNRKLIQDAITMLEDFQSSDELTSFSPSATLESEATEPGEKSEITLEVQNASSINGAAADVASKLLKQGYIVSAISTAPAVQNRTTIFHKAGKLGIAQSLREFLVSEGWPTDLQGISEQQVDIIIILGK